MIILTLLLQLFVGATCLGVAALCLFRRGESPLLALRIQKRPVLRVSLSLFSGLVGILSFAGIAVPFVAFFAACLGVMTAIGIFALARKRVPGLIVSGGLLLASIAMAMCQPLGLKVLLLPKAADLPYAPVVAEVVKTYDEGVWFESVRAGDDGTLYLAANEGLDFSRGDYYHAARGRVIERKSSGEEHTLFATPVGSTAGVIAIAKDRTLYMSSNGTAPGIWRISGTGQGERFARLPVGAWPNGLDFGPDGMLYSADSSLGVIWRINSTTGNSERVLIDPQLAPRSFLSLAPGANGLHFHGNDLIVTVSDRTTVLQYTLGADGRFSRGAILATGIPGDDFALGQDGSLFVTTHPYNTVVQISPTGKRSVIADARQNIVGATDAVFGRRPEDHDTLYVATDGGAFNGGPHTRGQLIALKPYADR